jgi:hypothetical protein
MPWPGVIFDDVAYARKRNGHTGWSLSEQSAFEEVRPIGDAWKLFERSQKSDVYTDVHCWVFVPSSFRLIIKFLSTVGLINLRELRFQVNDGEFFAVLSTDAPLGSLDLGELALAARAEERELRVVAEVEPPLVAEIESLRRHLSELTASTSWRLTAPLRATKAFLTKRIHGAG